MEEKTVQPDVQQEPQEPQQAQEPTQDTAPTAEQLKALADEVETWKARSRDWEKKAKANKAAAPELKSTKEELDELTERLKAAEDKLAANEAAEAHRRLVASVAKQTGVPAELIQAMKGDTEEELLAAAQMVKAAIPGAPVIRDGGNVQAKSFNQSEIFSIKDAKKRRQAILDNLDKFEN